MNAKSSLSTVFEAQVVSSVPIGIVVLHSPEISWHE